MPAPPVEPVPPERRAEAILLLCERVPAEQRAEQEKMLLTALGAEDARPQLLLGAYRAERLVGAVLARTQADRTAIVWTPRLVSNEPAATSSGLLLAAVDWLCEQDVRIAQIDLYSSPTADEKLLQEGGFGPLADLLYLVAQEDVFPNSKPNTQLQFVPYRPADNHRLARVAKATYVQSLDCPQLDGVRQIEDVLAGYRATGVFDPARWLMVRHGGEDIGCLLLADHPQHDNWELVYMGMVSVARGRAWGMDIARYAQWLTRCAGRPRLVLAVDAANAPAIRMYSAVGFRAWDRCTVYARLF